MSLTAEQQTKLERAQKIVGRTFENTQYLLSAITHPSATEGRAVKFSYERLEFLGDSILGALVANAAFHQFPRTGRGRPHAHQGGPRLRREPVGGGREARASPTSSCSAHRRPARAGAGCTRRSRTSTRPWWRRCSSTAASMRRGPSSIARSCPSMSLDLAREPENPKSALQEKLQEGGITPTYRAGGDPRAAPRPHLRRPGVRRATGACAAATGRTKKEAESQAAKSHARAPRRVLRHRHDRRSRPPRKPAEKAARAEEKAATKAARVAEREAAAAAKAAARAERAAANEEAGIRRPCI